MGVGAMAGDERDVEIAALEEENRWLRATLGAIATMSATACDLAGIGDRVAQDGPHLRGDGQIGGESGFG